MGLKCSLLGHAYGEPEVQRDREERGEEVVVTVREVQTCTRCGEESVVGENTEVRSVKPDPRETDADDGPGADASFASGGADPGGFAGVDDDFDDFDPDEDDAVILEDEHEEPPARERGQWPAADDTNLEEESPAADADADESAVLDADEGTDAGDAEASDAGGAEAANDPTASEEATDDADDDILIAEEVSGDAPAAGDSAPDAATDTGAAGGTAADSPGAFAASGSSEAASDPDDDVGGEGGVSGIQRAASVESSSADVDVDAELVCPSCGFSESAMGTSHRAGDICPECRRGYLGVE